jgi:lysozyme family protein
MSLDLSVGIVLPVPPAPVLHQDYALKFASMAIKPERAQECGEIADRIVANREVYSRVSEAVGKVPWWFIGCLHYRESNLNLETYLGNGQSLNHVTTLRPPGRGPFPGPDGFFHGCVDALKMLHFDKVVDWGIGNALYLAEEFNGEGYHYHGIPSPYVFGGTDVQRPGKYVRDGVFDRSQWDSQLGVAAILKTLYIRLGQL